MAVEKKTFELKPIESQLLSIANQQFQTMLSNLLTFIASERLAVSVTEQTRYELSGDLKSFQVWQEEPEVVTTEPSTLAQSMKDAINGEQIVKGKK